MSNYRIRVCKDQHDDSLSSVVSRCSENRSQACALLKGIVLCSMMLRAALLPILTSSKDTTDAHLVTLAKRLGLKLATLDKTLMIKPWAVGVAENPLIQPGH